MCTPEHKVEGLGILPFRSRGSLVVGNIPERHRPAAPSIPVLKEFPTPSDAARSHMVLLAGGVRDTLHLCRREDDALQWATVGP